MIANDEMIELATVYPGARSTVEGGRPYVFIPNVTLPDGCRPATADALLAPTPVGNYASLLYFASQIVSRTPRNWNGVVRILERNWVAISWRTRAGLRLVQQVRAHLEAFR